MRNEHYGMSYRDITEIQEKDPWTIYRLKK